MKKIKHCLLLLTVLLFIPFLQSCEDSGNGPTQITYPHTISFSHFENIEFMMWTDRAAMNTNGMNFIDFIEDEEDAYYLSSEYYESYNMTFTEDSIFSISPNGTIEGHPYFISNDTIYGQVAYGFPFDTVINVFLGLGSPSRFSLVQGFAQNCYTFNSGSMISYDSFLRQEFQTFASVGGYWGIPSVQSILAGDTLIINNRYVHFR